MTILSYDSIADIKFILTWRCRQALHKEFLLARGVNIWRDFIPEQITDKLVGCRLGQTVHFEFEPGDLLSAYNPMQTFTVKARQFNRDAAAGRHLRPRRGRFYPKGLLSDLHGIYPQNIEPFRCIEIVNGSLGVDFNHPLSRRKLQLSATIQQLYPKSSERGGTSHDWITTLCSGPGMQSRWRGRATDFITPGAFSRADETADRVFYRSPRLVQHLDECALAQVTALYDGLIAPHSEVLDLMASWRSHIPVRLELRRLVGLGLNRQELAANDRLTTYDVHDLNEQPRLPYDDQSFDAVVCNVSVEYLTQPWAVFEEVGRVLRPGGKFIVTFSNRWFPPKVIRVWPELHAFERMGLVNEFFLATGNFERLETYTMRGLPRPASDKYYPELTESDPLLAVWASKRPD